LNNDNYKYSLVNCIFLHCSDIIRLVMSGLAYKEIMPAVLKSFSMPNFSPGG